MNEVFLYSHDFVYECFFKLNIDSYLLNYFYIIVWLFKKKKIVNSPLLISEYETTVTNPSGNRTHVFTAGNFILLY